MSLGDGTTRARKPLQAGQLAQHRRPPPPLQVDTRRLVRIQGMVPNNARPPKGSVPTRNRCTTVPQSIPCQPTACSAGTYSSAGSTTCSTCAAGTYSGANAPSCSPCAAGTYSAANASSCSTCAAGTYSAANAAACSTCAAGTYSAANAALCTTCPAGTISNTGKTSCTGEHWT